MIVRDLLKLPSPKILIFSFFFTHPRERKNSGETSVPGSRCAVLAFLVFGPIAEKLQARTKEELLRRNLVIAGIESIICRHDRNLTQTHLDAYLAPSQREASSTDGGQGRR